MQSWLGRVVQFLAGTTPSVTVGAAQSPAYEIPGDTVTLPVIDAYAFADLVDA